MQLKDELVVRLFQSLLAIVSFFFEKKTRVLVLLCLASSCARLCARGGMSPTFFCFVVRQINLLLFPKVHISERY